MGLERFLWGSGSRYGVWGNPLGNLKGVTVRFVGFSAGLGGGRSLRVWRGL